MNNAKAAKNLLNETSCYKCIHLDEKKNRCSLCTLNIDDLPEELHCDSFTQSKKIR